MASRSLDEFYTDYERVNRWLTEIMAVYHETERKFEKLKQEKAQLRVELLKYMMGDGLMEEKLRTMTKNICDIADELISNKECAKIGLENVDDEIGGLERANKQQKEDNEASRMKLEEMNERLIRRKLGQSESDHNVDQSNAKCSKDREFISDASGINCKTTTSGHEKRNETLGPTGEQDEEKDIKPVEKEKYSARKGSASIRYDNCACDKEDTRIRSQKKQKQTDDEPVDPDKEKDVEAAAYKKCTTEKDNVHDNYDQKANDHDANTDDEKIQKQINVQPIDIDNESVHITCNRLPVSNHEINTVKRQKEQDESVHDDQDDVENMGNKLDNYLRRQESDVGNGRLAGYKGYPVESAKGSKSKARFYEQKTNSPPTDQHSAKPLGGTNVRNSTGIPKPISHPYGSARRASHRFRISKSGKCYESRKYKREKYVPEGQGHVTELKLEHINFAKELKKLRKKRAERLAAEAKAKIENSERHPQERTGAKHSNLLTTKQKSTKTLSSEKQRDNMTLAKSKHSGSISRYMPKVKNGEQCMYNKGDWRSKPLPSIPVSQKQNDRKLADHNKPEKTELLPPIKKSSPGLSPIPVAEITKQSCLHSPTVLVSFKTSTPLPPLATTKSINTTESVKDNLQDHQKTQKPIANDGREPARKAEAMWFSFSPSPPPNGAPKKQMKHRMPKLSSSKQAPLSFRT